MKIYFAPMEGITGYVFRNAYAACYGGVDTYFTPFLSNPVLNQIETNDVLLENNAGYHLIPQILTNRPDTFKAIATTLKDYGYSEVNLNLGCPSGTVVAKNRGSGALREPKELLKLLDGIFSTSPLPVSVKCRIGIHSEAEWEDILEVLLRFPMTCLIIHPRLQKEFYKGEVHPEAFRTAYEQILNGSAAPDAPLSLFYNGDICTVQDAARISEEFPRISGIMLGRGLLKDPELAERIRKSSTGPSHTEISLTETDPAAIPEGIDLPRLRRFLSLLLEGYRKEMNREGPALMKLKELWSYLQVYLGRTPAEMRPLWKTKTLAEYRDVVAMLVR